MPEGIISSALDLHMVSLRIARQSSFYLIRYVGSNPVQRS